MPRTQDPRAAVVAAPKTRSQDPKAYTRPFTAKVTNRLLPDTQLIEFVCLDKDAVHYVNGDPAQEKK